MKKTVLFVLVAVMVALISSVASAQYKDTLTWAQGSDVTSMDPHQGKETPAVQVTSQIFDMNCSRKSLKAGTLLTI